jgi:hypothetical protein
MIRVLVYSFIVAVSAVFYAQDNKNTDRTSSEKKSSGQVEVKSDEFSGKITIKLKPQTLLDTPDHKLTMELESHINPKEAAGSMVLLEEMTAVGFDSRSTKPIDFGDNELHFIIDGTPLPIGDASSSTPPPVLILSDKDEKGRKPYASFSAALSLSQLEQIANGKRVDMRLGSIKLTMEQSTLASLREFTNEFVSHAPTRQKKKGGRSKT